MESLEEEEFFIIIINSSGTQALAVKAMFCHGNNGGCYCAHFLNNQLLDLREIIIWVPD